MWHKPCRTFHPWCPCIKTRCLSESVMHIFITRPQWVNPSYLQSIPWGLALYQGCWCPGTLVPWLQNGLWDLVNIGILIFYLSHHNLFQDYISRHQSNVAVIIMSLLPKMSQHHFDAMVMVSLHHASVGQVKILSVSKSGLWKQILIVSPTYT